MKKLMIFMLMSAVICINAGCDKLLGPDELEPNADGIYVFHPEDMPQIQFKYDMSRWEMTVNNRASLTAHGDLNLTHTMRCMKGVNDLELLSDVMALQLNLQHD